MTIKRIKKNDPNWQNEETLNISKIKKLSSFFMLSQEEYETKIETKEEKEEQTQRLEREKWLSNL